MSLVGFKAKNHAQQIGKNGARDDVDDRGTKREFIDQMEARFGVFDLDVAAARHNTKAPAYFDIEHDGLTRPWEGRVWCNPPYSNIGAWVAKAHAEFGIGRAKTVVMLLPANRTEQKWWQSEVEPYRDRYYPRGTFRVEFLPGRMRFDRPSAVIGPKGDRPPFGCCLLIWESRA